MGEFFDDIDRLRRFQRRHKSVQQIAGYSSQEEFSRCACFKDSDARYRDLLVLNPCGLSFQLVVHINFAKITKQSEAKTAASHQNISNFF